jgi:DNA-directed RNA polymerase subunit L
MDVTSTVLGTYTIVFRDRDLDHAFGELLCEHMRDDVRVERASYYSDYDSHKVELVTKADVEVSAKTVVLDSLSRVISGVSTLLTLVGEA